MGALPLLGLRVEAEEVFLAAAAEPQQGAELAHLGLGQVEGTGDLLRRRDERGGSARR
jgi:hypothetical protein